MSSSAVNNNNNQAAANPLPLNPFSQWKSTTNLDPNNTAVSNLPNAIATLILSYLPIEQIETIIDSTPNQMKQYNVYRGIMGDAHCLDHNEHAKSSYTGKELEKFQRLLSLEGQALINGEPPAIKSWAELLATHEMSLTRLKNLDLSDSINMTDLDVIALTKSSPNLTSLILPDAFPSEEVMAVLRTNCPQAAIYPSAMTEHEWSHPAEFKAKLPPPPQEVEDFINGLRPHWPGKTASEAHMIVPRVNKIVRNVNGNSVMLPWTLNNVGSLDKATGGPGYTPTWDVVLQYAHDKFSAVGFEWVVLTKDVLLGSRNGHYGDHEDLTEQWGYEMPGFVDTITSMLWENRLSGNRIYGNAPYTYTRCKEVIGFNLQLAVHFTAGGVDIYCQRRFASDAIGIGGMQKFSVQRQLTQNGVV